jgi:hypothetical protein
MNDALETLARELEGKARALADFPQSLMHKEALQMLAAAAACRELSAQRSEGGYSAIRISDAKEATDAALAAFMEGR